MDNLRDLREASGEEEVARKYRRVAVGGTFEFLHKGHRVLLEKALEIGEKVLVGLTTDELAGRLGKKLSKSYDERYRQLKRFFERLGVIDRVEIKPLNDVYGLDILVYNPEYEAIVVSEETKRRAFEINEMRRGRGLRELDIVVVPLIVAEDGKPISSTRIKQGIIDEEGRLL